MRRSPALPGAHFLQTWEWGQVKSRFGWQPIPKIWRDEHGQPVAAALVLQRVLPIRGLAARLRLLYVPKGPLLDWQDAELRQQVLEDLADMARQRGAIFIKIDPDVRGGWATRVSLVRSRMPPVRRWSVTWRVWVGVSLTSKSSSVIPSCSI